MHIDKLYRYQPAIPTSIAMQASLCLRTTGPSARIQNGGLALCQAGSVSLQRPSQITLNFSPFFCTGLRAQPSQRPFSLAIRAHMTPPEDGIDKKKPEEARRGTVKLVAAAVVLACALGAMYTNWKARADEHSLFKWFSTQSPATGDHVPPTPPSIPGDAPPSIPGGAPVKEDTVQTKSKRALLEVLAPKFAPAVPKILVDLLGEAILPRGSEWATYLSRLRRGEKPDEIIQSMYEQLRKKTQISHEEDYKVGLVLIDLLIHQGDYKRAKEVCEKLESFAPESDTRPRIRREALDKLLQGGEQEVQEFIKRLEKELKGIKLGPSHD